MIKPTLLCALMAESSLKVGAKFDVDDLVGTARFLCALLFGLLLLLGGLRKLRLENLLHLELHLLLLEVGKGILILHADEIVRRHLMSESALIALSTYTQILQKLTDRQLLLIIDMQELAEAITFFALTANPVHADHLFFFEFIGRLHVETLRDAVELVDVQILQVVELMVIGR